MFFIQPGLEKRVAKRFSVNLLLILIFIVVDQIVLAASTHTENTQFIDCLLDEKSQVSSEELNSTKARSERCEDKNADYVKNTSVEVSAVIKKWQPLALKGDAEAQYYLGEAYEFRMDGEPDLEQAFKWYKRSAENHYAPAQLSLARFFEEGIEVKQNISKAIYWYQKSSDSRESRVSYTKFFADELSDFMSWNHSVKFLSGKQKTELDEITQQLEKTEQRLTQAKFEYEQLNQKSDDINFHIKQLSQPIKRNSVLINKTSIPIIGLSKNEDSNPEKNQSKPVLAENSQLSGKDQQDDPKLEELLPLPLEEIKELEIQLNSNKEALALAHIKSNQLASRLKLLEKKKDSFDESVSRLLSEEGPNIAFRWPEHETFSGVYKSEGAPGSQVNVIGAIYPHQLIKSFTINGESHEVDENGLFLKTVSLYEEPVTLELIAIDETGNSEKKLFIIEPNASLIAQPVAFQSTQLPEINFGNYFALVIGNSDYEPASGWDKLETTTNDAKAISKLLSDHYNFEVTTILDADHDSMLHALESIRARLTEMDNLLIYYAGHGYIDPENDQGYWIPTDGSTDSSVKWLSNSTITDQIRAMTARNVIVVADSCYSSSLMRSGLVSLRSGLSQYKKIERLNNDIKLVTRVVLSAGGLQPVADSIDRSEHSVFANAFLSVLKNSDNIIDADTLATQVGFIVSTATKDSIRQVPRYAPLARGGHQGGEFYFVPKNWDKSDI